jgi:hypothetical protein
LLKALCGSVASGMAKGSIPIGGGALNRTP